MTADYIVIEIAKPAGRKTGRPECVARANAGGIERMLVARRPADSGGTPAARLPNCALCEADGGELVWMGDRARVSSSSMSAFPASRRIVWNDHAAELTG